MPELPDVEGFRRVLEEHGEGRPITGVHVLDSGVLHDVSPQALEDAVRGQQFTAAQRRGKWLLAHTDRTTVILHFGMTGQLLPCAAGEAHHRHDRVCFVLEHGELRYRDQRKLTGIWLADEHSAVEDVLGQLGPDAADLPRRTLEHLLKARRRKLKPLLMDQEVLAGLGNLTVDETLWRAGLDPARRSDQLTEAEHARLHRALRHVLRYSIPSGRVPPRAGWLTGARQQQHPACPQCGAALERVVVGGRSTVHCATCQS